MWVDLVAVGGALLSALLVMLIGKRRRGRDFLGLAFALFVGGCLWGLSVASQLELSFPPIHSWADWWRPVGFYGLMGGMVALISGLPVFIVGLVFVLASSRAQTPPQ